MKEIVMGDENFSKKNSSILSSAIRYAHESTCHQRHAAIVVKGGRILGRGINVINNDPRQFGNEIDESGDKTLISTHAEISAMRGVSDENLRGSTVYVARISPGGNIALSKPCPDCSREMKKKGVRKVIYTNFC